MGVPLTPSRPERGDEGIPGGVIYKGFLGERKGYMHRHAGCRILGRPMILQVGYSSGRCRRDVQAKIKMGGPSFRYIHTERDRMINGSDSGTDRIQDGQRGAVELGSNGDEAEGRIMHKSNERVCYMYIRYQTRSWGGNGP